MPLIHIEYNVLHRNKRGWFFNNIQNVRVKNSYIGK